MQDLLSFVINLWDMHQGALIALLKGLGILVLGFYVASFAKSRITSALQHKDQTIAGFIGQIIFVSLLILGFITAIGTLGIQTNSIVALLGTAGLAIALGLQNSLSNLASGVIIIILRPFRAGDLIEFGSISGIVQSVSLFQTTLLLENNKRAIIPNETIAKGNIINHSNHPTKPLIWKLSLETSKSLKEIQSLLEKIFLLLNSCIQNPSIKIISAKNHFYVFSITLSIKGGAKEESLSVFIEQIKAHFQNFEISIRE